MSDRQLIIVDDGGGHWGPMTDLRASFELRTGAGISRWRIEQRFGLDTAALFVPPRLAPALAARYELPVNQPLPETAGDNCLLVNGRWTGVRRHETIAALRPGSGIVQHDGQLVAARAPAWQAQRIIEAGFKPIDGLEYDSIDERFLLEGPWHILDDLEAALEADGAWIGLPQWSGRDKLVIVEGAYPVKISREAQIDPGVFIDARKGPVYIHHGAVVHAMATLEGPCYIGTGSQVATHTSIRANTVIGPVCKVAGEISFSIMHGFSNKGHAGFLGHSLVGQWVNFGADTTVSNLKNTYGDVRVQLEPHGDAFDTGRTFHGPIVGDYVRTAIGSRLLTGSCIGTGAMVALSSFPPKCVPRFGFLTDEGAQPARMDKFIATARAMMARRKVELSPEEESLLRDLAARHGAGA